MMRRAASGLVWILAALGLSATWVALGPAAVKSAPGHRAAECPPCRADASSRGRALPYEIDERSVRLDWQ